VPRYPWSHWHWPLSTGSPCDAHVSFREYWQRGPAVCTSQRQEPFRTGSPCDVHVSFREYWQRAPAVCTSQRQEPFMEGLPNPLQVPLRVNSQRGPLALASQTHASSIVGSPCMLQLARDSPQNVPLLPGKHLQVPSPVMFPWPPLKPQGVPIASQALSAFGGDTHTKSMNLSQPKRGSVSWQCLGSKMFAGHSQHVAATAVINNQQTHPGLRPQTAAVRMRRRSRCRLVLGDVANWNSCVCHHESLGTRCTADSCTVYKGHVVASPVERRGLGWFQEAEVTCSGAGMGS
jgi:hypothetical protein